MNYENLNNEYLFSCMMKINFIPIDYSYFDFDGKNYVRMIGKDDNGKRVCAIDSCEVYLWAILKEGTNSKEIKILKEEISKIELNVKGRKTKVEKIEVYKKNSRFDLMPPLNVLQV